MTDRLGRCLDPSASSSSGRGGNTYRLNVMSAYNAMSPKGCVLGGDTDLPSESLSSLVTCSLQGDRHVQRPTMPYGNASSGCVCPGREECAGSWRSQLGVGTHKCSVQPCSPYPSWPHLETLGPPAALETQTPSWWWGDPKPSPSVQL